jgi:hypothetical protein
MSSPFLASILAVVLIDQLGASSYQKRQEAMQALQQLAPLIVPYLESVRGHQDLEIARRSEVILASYCEKAADHFIKRAKPTNWTYLPWIDMLPKDYTDRDIIVEYFLAEAREKIGRKGPPDWEDYRLATELYLHYLFLNQHSLPHAIELLDRMAAQERQWIANNGKNYTPPLTLPISAGGK